MFWGLFKRKSHAKVGMTLDLAYAVITMWDYGQEVEVDELTDAFAFYIKNNKLSELGYFPRSYAEMLILNNIITKDGDVVQTNPFN